MQVDGVQVMRVDAACGGTDGRQAGEKPSGGAGQGARRRGRHFGGDRARSISDALVRARQCGESMACATCGNLKIELPQKFWRRADARFTIGE